MTTNVLFHIMPTNVLFLAGHPNYLASVLWDGFRDLLGWTNVVCPVMPSHFIKPMGHPIDRITSSWYEPWTTMRAGMDAFDLLVVNNCVNNRFDANDWRKVGMKVVYVDGSDSANDLTNYPQTTFDAVFRREVDPSFAYPYDPIPLPFAAPRRWFTDASTRHDRPIDVFFAGSMNPEQTGRWEIARAIYQTDRPHNSVVCTTPVSDKEYFDLLRKSKICVVPQGAARSVCLRVFEAAACGAIPMFVGLPPWRRGVWFDDSMSFACENADHVRYILNRVSTFDLPAMRDRLVAHALEHHTTKARAETVLKGVGLL